MLNAFGSELDADPLEHVQRELKGAERVLRDYTEHARRRIRQLSQVVERRRAEFAALATGEPVDGRPIAPKL
jgi:hypothetical protein